MSQYHPRLEEFEFEGKSSKKPFGHSFKNLVYNEESEKILGRTPDGWVKLILFYIIFYGVLAVLFAICMVTFMEQFINPRVPRLQQEQSLIGTSPGLGFRPHPPDVKSTLIWYQATDYQYWENELIDFLSEYKKKGQTAGAGESIFNCGYDQFPPPGRVCDVNIRGWTPCIEENHFSFHKSKPCIFLKLNRIYGWRPEFLDPHDLPRDMPVTLHSYIKNVTVHDPKQANMTVWVSCQGETPTDQESIGELQYIPSPGFPGYFYPYENAEGYHSPLVAVHFASPKRGIVINVECRAWAKNIEYNRKEKLGVVHFELMIE